MEMETYDFFHCPNPNCSEKISAPFDAHCINRKRIREGQDILKCYRCPYCGIKWTVNDVQVNCIDVTGFKEGTGFVIIKGNEVIGRYSIKAAIKVGEKYYLHIPTAKVKEGRMFSIPEELTDEEAFLKVKEVI